MLFKGLSSASGRIAILVHKPAALKGVASVYQRHEFHQERARALNAWADHVVGNIDDNVVRIRPNSHSSCSD
jgi:hypothetical protein